jgi:hypothetical protein
VTSDGRTRYDANSEGKVEADSFNVLLRSIC